MERATSNSVVARWDGPAGAGAVGHFALRYRPLGAPQWTRHRPVGATRRDAEIANMTHGERYEIELDSVSLPAGDETADSGRPRRAEHTVRPNPVSNVAQLVDTRNLTLEWPRPAGRVDAYRLRWWPRGDESAAPPAERALPAPPPPQRSVRALLDGLLPGVGYTLTVAAHSYNLTSDLFTMETRTRQYLRTLLILSLILNRCTCIVIIFSLAWTHFEKSDFYKLYPFGPVFGKDR